MKEIKEFIWVYRDDMKPVAYVDDQEIVKFVCRDCFNGTITCSEDLEVERDHDDSNPATGPVYINGAEVGDVVAVDILDVIPVACGIVTSSDNNCGPFTKLVDKKVSYFDYKDGEMVWRDKNLSWKANPMVGTIGCASGHGSVPTVYVGDHGGNIDSPIITKGVTHYMPVRVQGGLLAMGDIHATMADGEMNGNGIEIAGDILVRIRLIKNFDLRYPVTETSDAYYVHTNGITCDEAIRKGYEEMGRLIQNAYGWDVTDTSIYMSVQGSLAANQACLSPNGGGNSFRTGTPKNKSLPPIIK